MTLDRYPSVFSRGLAGAILCLLIFIPLGCIGQKKQTRLQELLIRELKLTPAEITGLEQGRVLAKMLSSKEKREISGIGLVRVNVTQAEFLKRYMDIATFKQADEVLQIGKFSPEPKLSDLSGLTLDKEDADDVKGCKKGDCALKLSATMIESISSSVAASGQSKEMIDSAFRQALLTYVQSYLQQGAPALAAYADTKHPLSIAEDFSSLVGDSRLIQDYAPELAKYILSYPAGELTGSEMFVYWSKEKFGLKPVTSITQVFLYPRNSENRKELLIATKQLFADHYFDSSLGLAILAEEPDDTVLPGTYLVYLNLTRADALKGFLTGLRKSVVESKSLTALKNNLKLTKQRLESPVKR